MVEVPNVLSLILSLLSGASGAWLLEIWWRPRKERSRAALILLRELGLNRKTLAGLQPHVIASGKQPMISVDYTFSRIGLQSVGQALSELPPDVVGDVIVTYDLLEQLDKTFQTYRQASINLETISDHASHHGAATILRRNHMVGQFGTSLANAIPACDRAMDGLGRYANDPDWKKWVAERPRASMEPPN